MNSLKETIINYTQSTSYYNFEDCILKVKNKFSEDIIDFSLDLAKNRKGTFFESKKISDQYTFFIKAYHGYNWYGHYKAVDMWIILKEEEK